MSEQDPMERLSSAFTVTVDTETKGRHLAEISRELRTAPPLPVPRGFGLRRRVAALTAALVVFAPAAMAVAADDAVPGDFLYPVKQATERLIGLFDEDNAATNRVEEVERLVFRRAPHREIESAVRRAESATEQLDEPVELQLRLERAQELLRRESEQQGPAGGDRSMPADGESGDEPGGSTAPGAGGSSGHSGERSGETTTTVDTGGGSEGRAGTGSMSGSTTSTMPPAGSGGAEQP